MQANPCQVSQSPVVSGSCLLALCGRGQRCTLARSALSSQRTVAQPRSLSRLDQAMLFREGARPAVPYSLIAADFLLLCAILVLLYHNLCVEGHTFEKFRHYFHNHYELRVRHRRLHRCDSTSEPATQVLCRRPERVQGNF